MTFEDWKLCEGCNMFDPPFNCKDRVEPLFKGKQCPCVNCLLKVVCESQCDNMEFYRLGNKQTKKNIWKEKVKTF